MNTTTKNPNRPTSVNPAQNSKDSHNSITFQSPSNNTGANNKKFDIRDHLSSLTEDGGTHTQREASYHCPVCNAKNFKVELSTGKYSTFSCNCSKTENGKRQIRQAIAPIDQPEKSYNPKQKRQWVYTDFDGKPIMRAVRLDDGAGEKKVWREYKSGNQYLIPKTAAEKQIDLQKDKLEDTVSLLYINEVKAAAKQGKPIFYVEGESCTDAVRKIGAAATTHLGGCENWKDRYADDLKAAGVQEIILSPDRDRPGIELMDQVAESCRRRGITVKWLYVSANNGLWDRKIPETGGFDIKDYLEDNPKMTPENLFSEIECARRQFEYLFTKDSTDEVDTRYDKETNDTLNDFRNGITAWIDFYINATNEVDRAIAESQLHQRFKISKKRLEAIIAERIGGTAEKPQAKMMDISEIFTQEAVGVQWLIPGLIPKTGVTILAGDAGIGKSTLAYDAAAAVIYGDSFLGENPTATGKVLIVNSDEPINFAQDKLLNRGIQHNCKYLDGWDTSQWDVLQNAIEDYKPDLVIIDSFSSIHLDESFDENSPTAKATIYRLNHVLQKCNTSCILTHHLAKSKENKGVNKMRGSTAIAAAASMVWMIEGENETKHFHTPKTRGSEPLNLKIKLEPETGVFNVIEGQIYDDASKSLGDRILAFFEAHNDRSIRLGIEEIGEAITGNRDSLYKALNRLVKRGLLIKRPSNVNKRHKVWGLPKLEHTPPKDFTEKCPNDTKTTDTLKSQTLDNALDKGNNFTGQSQELMDTDKHLKPETTDKSDLQTLDGHDDSGGSVSQKSDPSNTVIEKTVPYSKLENGDQVVIHGEDDLHPNETGVIVQKYDKYDMVKVSFGTKTTIYGVEDVTAKYDVAKLRKIIS